MRAPRVLDERFEGSEQRFKAFVRHDHECRIAILQCVGLEPGEAALVDFRAHFYGDPDVVVRLPDRRLAVIELCFELFALDRRVSFEILIACRIGGQPPMRFSFAPQLRDLRAGALKPSHRAATVTERLIELHRTTDEIDTVSLARLLGTTQTWVTLHASRKERALRLVAKHTPIAGRLRGADGRFLFELERVLVFVSDFERLVARLEGRTTEDRLLPLLCARDPRIGTELFTLEMFLGNRERLGDPAGFIISTSSRGYSLVWPAVRQIELRPRATNENLPEPSVGSSNVSGT